MRGRFCSLAPAARTYAYTPTRLHRLTDAQTHAHTPTLQHSNTPPQAFVGARYERQARAFVPPALGAGHAAPGAGGRRKQPYMTMHTSNPSSCRLLCGSGLLFFIAGGGSCDAKNSWSSRSGGRRRLLDSILLSARPLDDPRTRWRGTRRRMFFLCMSVNCFERRQTDNHSGRGTQHRAETVFIRPRPIAYDLLPARYLPRPRPVHALKHAPPYAHAAVLL